MIEGLIFILGVVLGIVIGVFVKPRNLPKKAGTLFFYADEPGEPLTMFAELDAPIEDIYGLSQVIFTVSRK